MWTWLIIAGVLLVLEAVTGTFALLLAGVGALLAALMVFLFGSNFVIEVIVFALGSMAGAVVAWKRVRHRSKEPASMQESEGQTVVVVELPNAKGELRVRYRGTEWPALLLREDIQVEEAGLLRVVRQDGSVLILDQTR